MPSAQKDRDFAEEIIGHVDTKVDTSALDSAISWMKDNLSPDDIFDDDKLQKHIQSRFSPEDVFNQDELETWATDNGYIKQ